MLFCVDICCVGLAPVLTSRCDVSSLFFTGLFFHAALARVGVECVVLLCGVLPCALLRLALRTCTNKLDLSGSCKLLVSRCVGCLLGGWLVGWLVAWIIGQFVDWMFALWASR